MNKSDFRTEILKWLSIRIERMEASGLLISVTLPYEIQDDYGIAYQGSAVDCFDMLYNMYKDLEPVLMLTQTIKLVGDSKIEIIYFEYRKNRKLNVYKMEQSDIKLYSK